MSETTTAWAYKVVKAQRGGQGQWFRYPAAATFATQAEAEGYARRFAAEQKGVPGTRILVVARKGGAVVADLRVDDSPGHPAAGVAHHADCASAAGGACDCHPVAV